MRPLSACLMLRGGPGGHLRGQEGTKELISRDQRRHPPSSAFRTRGLALPPPTPEEVWVGGEPGLLVSTVLGAGADEGWGSGVGGPQRPWAELSLRLDVAAGPPAGASDPGERRS